MMEKLFKIEESKLNLWPEFNRFARSSIGFMQAAEDTGIPFNPKFNIVHWGFSVIHLCHEIAFGYCWMKAHAAYYKEKYNPGANPSDVYFYVSYYADNCITRLDSCRDKIALMIWSYYCNFNPEKRNEILDYRLIYDRLRSPLKYGLNLKNITQLEKILKKLNDESFNRIELYRNLKIHRLEPRIEIYGVKSHHGWPYMIPLYNEKDINSFRKKLTKEPPGNNDFNKVNDDCMIDGIFFDQRKIKDSVWDYDEISKLIENWLKKIMVGCSDCFQLFKKRYPLRKGSSNLKRKKP